MIFFTIELIFIAILTINISCGPDDSNIENPNNDSYSDISTLQETIDLMPTRVLKDLLSSNILDSEDEWEVSPINYQDELLKKFQILIKEKDIVYCTQNDITTMNSIFKCIHKLDTEKGCYGQNNTQIDQCEEAINWEEDLNKIEGCGYIDQFSSSCLNRLEYVFKAKKSVITLSYELNGFKDPNDKFGKEEDSENNFNLDINDANLCSESYKGAILSFLSYDFPNKKNKNKETIIKDNNFTDILKKIDINSIVEINKSSTADGGYAFLAYEKIQNNKTRCHITFQGTNELKDIYIDLISLQKVDCYTYNKSFIGQCGLGFYKQYKNIRDSKMKDESLFIEHIKKTCLDNDNEVFIYGHSLGGALASMLGIEISLDNDMIVKNDRLKIFTFGEPRFLSGKNARVYHNNIQKHRWINVGDIIPSIVANGKYFSLGYSHFGETWSIKKNWFRKLTFNHKNRDYDSFGFRFLGEMILGQYSINYYHSLNSYIKRLKSCK